MDKAEDRKKSILCIEHNGMKVLYSFYILHSASTVYDAKLKIYTRIHTKYEHKE